MALLCFKDPLVSSRCCAIHREVRLFAVRLSGTREDGRGLAWGWERTWEEVKRHAYGRKSEVGAISAARVLLFFKISIF